jgi:hypothetical protein
MSDKTTVTVTVVNGELLIDAAAMAVLCGVGEDLVSAHWRHSPSDAYVTFPPAWMRAGKRRAKEAVAHTGKDDLLSVLEYWVRQAGSELEIVYDEATR